MNKWKVINHRKLFDPPLASRKSDDTDKSLEKRKAWAEEKNRELREQIEKDEGEGANVTKKYGCTMAANNDNLSSRNTK